MAHAFPFILIDNHETKDFIKEVKQEETYYQLSSKFSVQNIPEDDQEGNFHAAVQNEPWSNHKTEDVLKESCNQQESSKFTVLNIPEDEQEVQYEPSSDHCDNNPGVNINNKLIPDQKQNLTICIEDVYSVTDVETKIQSDFGETELIKVNTNVKKTDSERNSCVSVSGMQTCSLQTDARISSQTADKATNAANYPKSKASLECKVCGKYFAYSSSLKQHGKIHTGVKPFECKVCGKCFTHGIDLQVHSRVHTREKPFQCKVCGKSFSQSRGLERHHSIHTNVKPFECKVCGKLFAQSSYLKQHQSIHTVEMPFQCEVCGKCFSRAGRLREHGTIHTGEKPFRCKVCGKGFTREPNLRRHNTIHTVKLGLKMIG